MKSLKERLADKRAREEKEAMKLSNAVKCFNVRLPWGGFPCGTTKGDILYFKERAAVLVNKLTRNCSSQFYQAVKDEIARTEKEREESQKTRLGLWQRIANDDFSAVASPTPAGEVVTRDVPTQPTEPVGAGINPAYYGTITFTGPAAEEASIDHIQPIAPSTVSPNGEPELPESLRTPAGYRLATEPAMDNETAQREFTLSEIERIKELQIRLGEIQTELNGMGIGQQLTPEQVEDEALTTLLEELNIPQSGEALSHSVANNIAEDLNT